MGACNYALPSSRLHASPAARVPAAAVAIPKAYQSKTLILSHANSDFGSMVMLPPQLSCLCAHAAPPKPPVQVCSPKPRQCKQCVKPPYAKPCHHMPNGGTIPLCQTGFDRTYACCCKETPCCICPMLFSLLSIKAIELPPQV